MVVVVYGGDENENEGKDGNPRVDGSNGGEEIGGMTGTMEEGSSAARDLSWYVPTKVDHWINAV